MKILIALAGMLLTLALAWGLDFWVASSRLSASQPGGLFPLLWLTIFAQLAVASALINLAWYAVYRAPRALAIALPYALVGLAVTISPLLYYYDPGVGRYFYQSINSLFRQAGTFVFLIGLANFFLGSRPRRLQPTPTAEP